MVCFLFRFFSPENRAVTNKLLFFTVLMVVIPVMAFYAAYIFLFDWKEEGLAWSGFIAVAATNLVVVAYVAMAWNEDQEDMKSRNVPNEKAATSASNTLTQKKEN